ncbi:helix-turn-helix domain-containing protein [Candidatus Poribacteria bacterium]|nr:helix-turn-helix domain-containing protein [Candidatus Poribacteria bacterium]
MGKIESTLKTEISRLARKELRTAVGSLSKRVGELKQKISQLSKIVANMNKAATLEPGSRTAKGQPQPASNAEIKAARITGRVVRNIRKKLDITQDKLALLLDVSPGAVAFWEQGRARPRGANKAAIVALRKLGRRDVKRFLAEKGAAAKSRKTK